MITIEKQDYSLHPWRLLRDGRQMTREVMFDHHALGNTKVDAPICGPTKSAVMTEALAMLEAALMQLEDKRA